MEGPLILPKGVIKNSSTINHSIEQFQTSPLDLADIAKLWKVYTTTKRRLLDPTAERLENYWWRIWGSRSRNLKAVTVAQIFADISDGHSFVPLTSQANRDEGTPPPSYKQVHAGATSTMSNHRPSVGKLSTTPKQVDPPLSILKNSDSNKRARNSSQTGPKPVARFVSPQESETESPTISAKNTITIEPPSPTVQELKSEKKLTVPSGKKKTLFVVSGRGKRPVAVRRQSSQSSTDGPSKIAEVVVVQSSADRTPPQLSDQARFRPRSSISSQETSSSSSGRGDKKIRTVKVSEGKHSSPRKSSQGSRATSKDGAGDPGSSSRPRAEATGQITPDDLMPEEMDEVELQSLLLAEANARQQAQKCTEQASLTPAPNHFQTDLRKISDGAEQHVQQRSRSAINLGSSVAGQSSHKYDAREEPRKVDKGKSREPVFVPTNGLFSKRPVQSLASTSIPDSAGGLSRSKSQLTLLLERDRVATSNNQRSSSSIDLKGKKKA